INRHHREAAAHAGPAGAVVQAEEHPGFGAGEQQAGPFRVGAQNRGDLVAR
ncbi:hypothetical protein BAL199_15223, partial [alpha proteobacterium BAL199]